MNEKFNVTGMTCSACSAASFSLFLMENNSLLGWKLNPMFGAAAMSMSSVCVLTNALRLKLFKIKRVEIENLKNEDLNQIDNKETVKGENEDMKSIYYS